MRRHASVSPSFGILPHGNGRGKGILIGHLMGDVRCNSQAVGEYISGWQTDEARLMVEPPSLVPAPPSLVAASPLQPEVEEGRSGRATPYQGRLRAQWGAKLISEAKGEE